MRDTTLTIQGMSCGHCVKAVTNALEALPGVKIKKVEVGRAELSFDESKIGPEALLAALQEEGYPATQKQ